MSEQLIYALSSLKQVTLERYNELFKMLYLPECGSFKSGTEINHRGQASRILDSLGYLEFDYEARKVFACPPALIMLPSMGLPKALLTGARTPALLTKVKNVIRKHKNMVNLNRYCQTKKGLSLPDTILVEAADIGSLRDVSNEAGILLSSETPAGWEIANFSVSIKDIERELNFITREDINWKKRTFDKKWLRFSYSNDKLDEYLLAEYTHPLTQQKRHWIWNGTTASEVERDWGRYLVLKNFGNNIIIYDETKEYLGIPLTVPLPKILARSAALCSGKAPLIHKINCSKLKMPNDVPFCLYTEVPEVVAELIAQKVGQKIILRKISITKERRDYD
jgi:hypothetical protein